MQATQSDSKKEGILRDALSQYVGGHCGGHRRKFAKIGENNFKRKIP